MAMSANNIQTATSTSNSVSDSPERLEQIAKWQAVSEEAHSAFEVRRYTQAETRFLDALIIAEQLSGVVTSEAKDELDQNIITTIATMAKNAIDTKPQSPTQFLRPAYRIVDVSEEDLVRLAKSLNNLAALYHLQGKFFLAENLYDRCLDIKLALYGEEHLETAINLHNLAVLNCAKKKWEKAEILFKRALEIREKLLSENDPELIPILKNYGIMLRKTLREDDAKSVEARIAAIEALKAS
jgi:tetratricopeptide (TPR) repeat protein